MSPRCRTLDPAALAPIRRGRRGHGGRALGGTPLIGFAGAPFTLASYLVEGGPSREHLRTKALMHGDPETWHALAGWVAGVTGAFLRAQALAGASAVQLFDSWAGALSLADYTRFVAPHSAAVLAGGGRPGRPPGALRRRHRRAAGAMRDVGADVMGIDHRVPLDVANGRLGGRTPLQGNIDPALLFAGPDALHAPGRRRHPARRRRARPRGQPRPRRSAGHRPGRADPAGRVRARLQRVDAAR